MCSTCSGPTSRKEYTNCWQCKVKINKAKAIRCHPEYNRFRHMKWKYNLDKEQFEKMWERCGGNCEICGNPMKEPEKRQGQSLEVCAIDHDHVTGLVRGLLCNGCNKGLGFFKDNINLLNKAKEYLNGAKTSVYPTSKKDCPD